MQSFKRCCGLAYALSAIVCCNASATQNQKTEIPKELIGPDYDDLSPETKRAWNATQSAINTAWRYNKGTVLVRNSLETLIKLDKNAINAQRIRKCEDFSLDSLEVFYHDSLARYAFAFLCLPLVDRDPPLLLAITALLLKHGASPFLFSDGHTMFCRAIETDFEPCYAPHPTAQSFVSLIKHSNFNSITGQHLRFVRQHIEDHITSQLVRAEDLDNIKDAEQRLAILKQAFLLFPRFPSCSAIQKNLQEQLSNQQSHFDASFAFE